jgi:hypothetical protein
VTKKEKPVDPMSSHSFPLGFTAPPCHWRTLLDRDARDNLGQPRQTRAGEAANGRNGEEEEKPIREGTRIHTKELLAFLIRVPFVFIRGFCPTGCAPNRGRAEPANQRIGETGKRKFRGGLVDLPLVIHFAAMGD